MSEEELYRKVKQHLLDYIATQHLRQTNERYTILRAICKMKQFTVNQLAESLKDGLTISHATVYNTLLLLEKANIIQKLDKQYGQRVGTYELIVNEGSHVEIICQKCGRVREVKDPTIQRVLADKRFSNFVPERFSLYIFGACKSCHTKHK